MTRQSVRVFFLALLTPLLWAPVLAERVEEDVDDDVNVYSDVVEAQAVNVTIHQQMQMGSPHKLKNAGKNCYWHCGWKGGRCDKYCGKGNLCCHGSGARWLDPPECKGLTHPGISHHTCMRPNSAMGEGKAVKMYRHQYDDGKKCATEETLFDLRGEQATTDECTIKCDADKLCVAFSGRDGSWCVGCKVDLSVKDDDECEEFNCQAYYKSQVRPSDLIEHALEELEEIWQAIKSEHFSGVHSAFEEALDTMRQTVKMVTPFTELLNVKVDLEQGIEDLSKAMEGYTKAKTDQELMQWEMAMEDAREDLAQAFVDLEDDIVEAHEDFKKASKEIMALGKEIRAIRDSVWKGNVDQVFDAIDNAWRRVQAILRLMGQESKAVEDLRKVFADLGEAGQRCWSGGAFGALSCVASLLEIGSDLVTAVKDLSKEMKSGLGEGWDKLKNTANNVKAAIE